MSPWVPASALAPCTTHGGPGERARRHSAYATSSSPCHCSGPGAEGTISHTTPLESMPPPICGLLPKQQQHSVEVAESAKPAADCASSWLSSAFAAVLHPLPDRPTDLLPAPAVCSRKRAFHGNVGEPGTSQRRGEGAEGRGACLMLQQCWW
jgi:hypothetical protein